jgi:phosphoribosylaminoimidazole carboxylase PurE protein
VVSAHRTPDLLFAMPRRRSRRGIQVIIAGAGGAAHLPGMLAAKTRLPVLGVPVQSKALNGMDSLLSIAQMPAGIPVGTLAIGRAGAVNAGLLAAAVLALHDPALATALEAWRTRRPRPCWISRIRAMSRTRQPVLGILGGGQLARMLALAAAPLGVKTLVVDSAPDACAGQVAPLVVADWTDYAALEAFAAEVDVVTFDFENVPAETAHWLAERVAVFPDRRRLAVAQDRLAEKTLFRECGLQTPEFMAVDTREDLDRALAAIGAPAISRRAGSATTARVSSVSSSMSDADAAWAALGAQASRMV